MNHGRCNEGHTLPILRLCQNGFLQSLVLDGVRVMFQNKSGIAERLPEMPGVLPDDRAIGCKIEDPAGMGVLCCVNTETEAGVSLAASGGNIEPVNAGIGVLPGRTTLVGDFLPQKVDRAGLLQVRKKMLHGVRQCGPVGCLSGWQGRVFLKMGGVGPISIDQCTK